MINEGFVKSIVSEVKADLFEGGAGSGNWGHKGRPGMRGGSLGGGKGKGGGISISAHKAGGGGKGAKTTGKGWGALPKARAMTSNEKKFWGKFRKEREGGGKAAGGISAHVVKSGQAVGMVAYHAKTGRTGTVTKVHKGVYGASEVSHISVDFGGKSVRIPARELQLRGISAHKITVGGQKLHGRDYYNAAGKLDAANYSKLSGANKTQVLKHGIQKYKESYVPKAYQGKLDANGLSANKKIGALEGMRRAAVTKAKSSTGKESRAAMHVAISLQARANAVFSQIKVSGSKAVGSATSLGSKVIGASLTAVRIAGRPVGR